MAEKRAASFRGVPFYVFTRKRDGGRRGPTNEFPQRDEPDGEDLGRQARAFAVEAIVLGPDYGARRDRLLAALETAGPGLYVDPWQGEWTVIARRYSCVESDKEGGAARFSITFEESGQELFPRASLDTAAGVLGAAGVVVDAARVLFDRAYTVERLPSFVPERAARIADRLGAELLRGSLRLPRLDPAQVLGAADWPLALATFRASTLDFARAGLGDGIVDLFRALADGSYRAVGSRAVAGDPVEAAALFGGLTDFGDAQAPVAATTTTPAVEARNQAAIAALVERVAAAEHARAMAAVAFDSYDAGQAALATTTGYLDRVTARAAADFDDSAYRALKDLRQATVADIRARSGELPRLRRVRLARALPAAVVAHRLHGDARRAADLLRRNPFVVHPGFVPPGRDLEILNFTAEPRRGVHTGTA